MTQLIAYIRSQLVSFGVTDVHYEKTESSLHFRLLTLAHGQKEFDLKPDASDLEEKLNEIRKELTA